MPFGSFYIANPSPELWQILFHAVHRCWWFIDFQGLVQSLGQFFLVFKVLLCSH
jgi:hypothetical protein